MSTRPLDPFSLIDNAQHSLHKALLAVRNGPHAVEGPYAELLTTRLEHTRDIVDLFIKATTQHLQIDWDAELRAIGEL